MSKPSKKKFVEGMARVLDLGATLAISPSLETNADKKALASDWRAIGEELRQAMSNYEQKLA
jgi:hypothetical protein